MANNTTVENEGGSSITPFLIIGLILLATIAGIWWISQSGASSETANSNSAENSNSANQSSGDVYAKAPPGASPSHFKGGESATVLVEEFADFQCGACAQKHPVFNELMSEYGNKIKFVFRNYPLPMHNKAYEAAVAAEAAGLQGKFWEMQNLLFANQQKWIADSGHRRLFDEYAKTIGIDVEKFNNDFLGVAAKTRVDADMKRGNGVGLKSTPTLFVNGKSIAYELMTLEGLKPIIDAELKKSESGDDDKSDSDEKKSDEADKKSSEDDEKKSEDEGADKKEDEKK